MSWLQRQLFIVRNLSLFNRPYNVKQFQPLQVSCQKCKQVPLFSYSTSCHQKSLWESNVATRLLLQPRRFSSSNRTFSIQLLEPIKKNLYKIGYVFPEKYKKIELRHFAKVLLNDLYMKVPFKNLCEVAGLEDSFSMWLKILYVHLWFIVARLKDGGRDGQIVLQFMFSMLWEDLTERLKEMENEMQRNLKSKTVLTEFQEGLYEFFVLLDEGMLSSDSVLASSLWSLIYKDNSYDAQAWHLENLVHYIRHTNARMEGISADVLISPENDLEWAFPAKEIPLHC